MSEAQSPKYPERLLIKCDRVWLEWFDSGACLMLSTTSPFAKVEGFDALLQFGQETFIAHFELGVATSHVGHCRVKAHFRATKLRSAQPERLVLSTPKLVLSGPPLGGRTEL